MKKFLVVTVVSFIVMGILTFIGLNFVTWLTKEIEASNRPHHPLPSNSYPILQIELCIEFKHSVRSLPLGSGPPCAPVIHSQTRHPAEFAHVVAHQGRIQGQGMSGDKGVEGADRAALALINMSLAKGLTGSHASFFPPAFHG